MEEKWKKLATTYSEKDWSFSSARAWEKVIAEDLNPYNLIQYADQLRLSGNFSEAETILEKVNIEAISRENQFVFYIRKGMLFEDQGKWDEAIESYRKSIQYQSEETYPYVFLAGLLSMKSQLDEAENVLQEALKKEGDIDEVYYNLGLIYARKGAFKKAIEALTECIKIDPDYPDAKTWLADFENMENTTDEVS